MNVVLNEAGKVCFTSQTEQAAIEAAQMLRHLIGGVWQVVCADGKRKVYGKAAPSDSTKAQVVLPLIAKGGK